MEGVGVRWRLNAQANKAMSAADGQECLSWEDDMLKFELNAQSELQKVALRGLRIGAYEGAEVWGGPR